MLSKLTIGQKFALLIAISTLCTGGLILTLLPAVFNFAVSLKVEQVRAITETARNAGLMLNGKAEAGEITHDEARQRFYDLLNAMWYDNNKEYVFASTYDGILVVNPASPNIVGTDRSGVTDRNGFPYIREMIRLAKEEGGGRVDYMRQTADGDTPVQKVSYVSAVEPFGLFVGTGLYTQRLEAEFAKFRNLAIGITLAGLLVVVTLGWIIAMHIKLPAQALALQLEELADGRTVEDSPYGHRRDAIGKIARAFSRLREAMAERAALQAAQAAEKAQRDAALRTAMLEMADSLENNVGREITAMRGEATGMAERSRALSSLAERMRATADDTFAACEVTGASVQSVAAATEELSASSAEIGRQVSETARISRATVEAAEVASRSVKALAQASESITAVVKLITEIAGQTNLLALNATIEAARAGEAGRGFSIVAQEVKHLADQTASATGRISEEMQGILSGTSASVDAIEGIYARVETVSEHANAIAAQVEEQNSAIAEIARTLQNVSQSTNHVSETMTKMRAEAEDTGEAVEEMQVASTTLTSRSGTVNAAVTAFLDELRTSDNDNASRGAVRNG